MNTSDETQAHEKDLVLPIIRVGCNTLLRCVTLSGPNNDTYYVTREDAEVIAGQIISIIETFDSWDRIEQKKRDDAAGY